MTLEDAILTLLRNSPGVTSLLGEGNTLRVYPVVRPQRKGAETVAPPDVVYAIETEDEDQTHDGPTGLLTSYLTVTAYAQTRVEAKRVSKAIREVITGYSGTVVNTSSGETYDIDAILRDGGGADVYDDERREFGYEIQFQVLHHDS